MKFDRRQLLKLFGSAITLSLIPSGLVESDPIDKGLGFFRERSQWRAILILENGTKLWGPRAHSVEKGPNYLEIRAEMVITETMALRGFQIVSDNGVVLPEKHQFWVNMCVGDTLKINYRLTVS